MSLQAELAKAHGDFFRIPEGGANAEGVRGAEVMGWAISRQLDSMPVKPTQVCLACGTSNTMAGVVAGLHSDRLHASNLGVVGFSVLKGEGDLGRQILAQQSTLVSAPGLAGQAPSWRLISGYHGGGYARKLPPQIHQFGHKFEAETGVLLDPVYTLKMVWGVAQLLRQNYWPRGSRLLLVHTGGMQGRRGFEY